MALALVWLPLSVAGQESPSIGALFEQLSEDGRYFDTDNLVSNESSYGQVFERLTPRGGIYLGVRPEQNFSYIARLRPDWAFLVDIRRDNALHHLLLNYVLSVSPSPGEYLARLFSRPLSATAGRVEGSGLVMAMKQVAWEDGTDELFEANLEAAYRHIEGTLDFRLKALDRDKIREVYRAFFDQQLELRFTSHGRRPRPGYPSYGELLAARDEGGDFINFLADAQGYRHLRDLALRGRLVPVVGDLGGGKALRSIASHLEAEAPGEQVRAIYTSNVEFYLLGDGRYSRFVDNVAALPLAEDALIIRSYFSYGLRHPQSWPGHRSTVLLQDARGFVDQHRTRPYRDYWDVCTRDIVPTEASSTGR